MPVFLVGLMLGFRNPATRRLRYFVLLSLCVLIVVQALGRTQLSDDSPESIPKTCWCCSCRWCSCMSPACSSCCSIR